jgi:plasmid stabilization system protein ParE
MHIVASATRQIRAAAEWWRRHRDKAPHAFDDDIDEAFALIRREPGVGVPARYGRHSDVRRLYLERIRYYIYYRVVNDEVLILAIRHASRRPPRL